MVLDREAVTRLLAADAAAQSSGTLDMGAWDARIGRDGTLPGLPEGTSVLLDRLTVRERSVLELMAEGRSNGAIAESLVVSLGAIEKHITNIFAKLDLPACDEDHRRVLAVLAYLRVAR